jgi:hypothetical protein
MKKQLLLTYCLWIIFGLGNFSFAQIMEVPINTAISKPNKNNSSSVQRLKSEEPDPETEIGDDENEEEDEEDNGDEDKKIVLNLPFWDDFSTYTGRPDPKLWYKSDNVFINDGLSIRPPSLNAATFDGVDKRGRPYRTEPLAFGLCDELTSHLIDLEGYENQGVAISFFWQAKGKGERPDSEDFIRLQFLDKDKEWETVWSQNGTDNLNTSVFTQEFIPVTDSKFFHEDFQFRFQSFGKQSGRYDHWHIDYIYLNEKRHPNNFNAFYPDRAVVSMPTSIFKEFTAIPIYQFFASKATAKAYLKKPKIAISNLNNNRQEVTYYARLKHDGKVFYELDINTPKEGGIQALEITDLILGKEKNFDSAPFFNANLMVDRNQEEPIVAELEIDIESDDTIMYHIISNEERIPIPEVDLRVNNTVKRNFMLHDYFAYDDGSAEYGAGINQQFGMIAYAFDVKERDVLTHIDIHFPRISGRIANTSITGFVLRNLGTGPQDYYIKQNFIIGPDTTLNQFQRFEFFRPIGVEGTIYIGFEQSSTDFVPVGLDKSSNSAHNLYYNIDGINWVRNDTINGVRGNLMMRPVFQKGLVTSTHPNIVHAKMVKVFPNPSKGIFNLKGNFEALKIIDLWGREVFSLENFRQETEHRIDLSHCPNGIYILHLSGQNQKQIEKIVIER